MTRRPRTVRNFIPPLLILAPLLWLMVGCLYVPWFEHRIDSGPNVRALVGDSDTNHPIRPGHTTREQVIALLGRAPYISEDGNALGYASNTSVASWVYPLCFAAEPADAKTYVVRLVFDNKGQLLRYDWADESEYLDPDLLLAMVPRVGPVESVIKKLNKTGPILYPRIRYDRMREWPSTLP